MALLGFAAAAGGQTAVRVAVRGAYASPKSFWAQGARLDEYGINAIFVHSGAVTADLLSRAREEGALVFAEFATLNGKGYVENHPEAWPVNERGEKSPQATWFLGVCPTDPGFRQYRMEQLRRLLESAPIAGLWMDYFHWHAQFEDPSPILPETCFNESCLQRFRTDTGIQLPAGSPAETAPLILARHERAWRDWRCSILLEWAREIRKTLAAKQPHALLGLYHCPWNDVEYDGARRRILGLDLEKLAPLIDVFSPMVYHGRMGRSPQWVGEYAGWLCDRVGIRAGRVERQGATVRLNVTPQVWPIVQAHNDPGMISAREFETVLRLGASSQCTGVMMFTLGAVAEDPAKLGLLKRIYSEWSGPK